MKVISYHTSGNYIFFCWKNLCILQLIYDTTEVLVIISHDFSAINSPNSKSSLTAAQLFSFQVSAAV
jgi:hypothetical protein